MNPLAYSTLQLRISDGHQSSPSRYETDVPAECGFLLGGKLPYNALAGDLIPDYVCDVGFQVK